MSSAPSTRLLQSQVVHRLEDETRLLRADLEEEASTLLRARTPLDYQRFLTRTFGFLSPLERSLLDTSGLAPFLDTRRLRKRSLIEADLLRLGLKAADLQSIPQCMWIPWFDNPWTALGWAYLVERSTLAFPHLFRYLANVLPGQAAFAATYLKVYGPATTEMWKSFANGLDLAGATPANLDRIIDGATSGLRHFRRWCDLLDGKSLSTRTG